MTKEQAKELYNSMPHGWQHGTRQAGLSILADGSQNPEWVVWVNFVSIPTATFTDYKKTKAWYSYLLSCAAVPEKQQSERTRMSDSKTSPDWLE